MSALKHLERRSKEAIERIRLDNYAEQRNNEYQKGHSRVDKNNAMVQALRDEDLQGTCELLTTDYREYYEVKKKFFDKVLLVNT